MVPTAASTRHFTCKSSTPRETCCCRIWQTKRRPPSNSEIWTLAARFWSRSTRKTQRAKVIPWRWAARPYQCQGKERVHPKRLKNASYATSSWLLCSCSVLLASTADCRRRFTCKYTTPDVLCNCSPPYRTIPRQHSISPTSIPATRCWWRSTPRTPKARANRWHLPSRELVSIKIGTLIIFVKFSLLNGVVNGFLRSYRLHAVINPVTALSQFFLTY